MAGKTKKEHVLTDRLRLEVPTTGDLGVVYARVSLDEFINPLENDIVSVKQIYLQPRYPTNTQLQLNNTGAWSFPYDDLDGTNALGANFSDSSRYAAFKIMATTVAYQDAQLCGIATPGILHMEEWVMFQHVTSLRDQETAPSLSAAAYGAVVDTKHNVYGITSYRPNGMPVASDILVGISTDNWFNAALGTAETLDIDVDVVIVMESRKATKADLADLSMNNDR